ncbi:hypothetical protein AB3S75_047535 [Citrus x aurantiifolia]
MIKQLNKSFPKELRSGTAEVRNRIKNSTVFPSKKVCSSFKLLSTSKVRFLICVSHPSTYQLLGPTSFSGSHLIWREILF